MWLVSRSNRQSLSAPNGTAVRLRPARPASLSASIPLGALDRALACVALLICLVANTARSATTCLAVFVGNDKGLARETPLRYAASDARKISEIFRNSSAFTKTEITVLANEGEAKIRSELDRVKARATALKGNGETVVLLFFFSGHGSARSLHLSGRELPRSELQDYYASGEFDIRIVILDACESGDFLRQKGDVAASSHDFSASAETDARGIMVLSSSARGELAQESDEYGEGVFSHHLMNALRGLGDFNGDSRVGVLEAFEYSQVSTRGERIAGHTNMQNPGFDLDWVGTGDLALTNLHSRKSVVHFQGFPLGEAEIFDAYTSRAVEKMRFTGAENASFFLRPGSYVLVFRNGERSGYCEFTLSSRDICQVKAVNIRTRPATASRGKGMPELPFRSRILESSVRISAPIRGGEVAFLGVEYAHSFSPSLELGLGLGAGNDHRVLSASRLDVENRFYLVESNLRWALVQAGSLGLWCGAGGGVWLLDQKIKDGRLFAGPIETEEGTLNPTRRARSAILRLAFPISFRIRPHPRTFFEGGVGLAFHGYGKTGEILINRSLERNFSLGAYF